jgi:hypothetical protein
MWLRKGCFVHDDDDDHDYGGAGNGNDDDDDDDDAHFVLSSFQSQLVRTSRQQEAQTVV